MEMKTMKLEELKRKFIDSISLKNWEVLGDEGYVDIVSIKKTVKYDEYVVVDDLGHVLFCADDHSLIAEDGSEIYAKDSLNRKIRTKDGISLVTFVENTGKRVNMYDLELPEGSDHLYYTNGILSHNTTTYTIYLLWLTMFFSEKKVMILANKKDTAIEICERIRLAYQYLPSFLKAAVVTWNKAEIGFANRSLIKAFSTSSDSARGFSASCVQKTHVILVRPKWRILRWLRFHISLRSLRCMASFQNVIMRMFRPSGTLSGRC